MPNDLLEVESSRNTKISYVSTSGPAILIIRSGKFWQQTGPRGGGVEQRNGTVRGETYRHRQVLCLVLPSTHWRQSRLRLLVTSRVDRVDRIDRAVDKIDRHVQLVDSVDRTVDSVDFNNIDRVEVEFDANVHEAL